MGSLSTAAQQELRAWAIADDVASVWWTSGAHDNVAIPLGVLAALSLVAARDSQPGPDLAEQISALDQDRFASFLSRVWGLFAITRPELAIRTGPFARWLDNQDGWSQHHGAWVTARSVLATGQLFTGDQRALFTETDVLGCAYQVLANPRGAKSRGEVYTAPDVAGLLMRICLAGARPGQTIMDDGAGTGSLIRGAAQFLRSNDIDPRTMHWYATDTDPIAVAALAVNAHLWDLGSHVIIGRADILTEPDWPDRAAAEQMKALRDHDLRLTLARLLAAEHVFGTYNLREPGPREET